jgi:predicted nucleotidyltransferase component of viral defense system
MTKPHYDTVDPYLKLVLKKLMDEPLFDAFRLVGGTSLSLQIGHRISVDIDLFTDAPYRSIDFSAIDNYFIDNFSFVDRANDVEDGFGRMYFVGESSSKAIKIDLMYTDTFIRDTIDIGGIRVAAIEEIVAMKLDVMARVRRKKDFWDIHSCLEHFAWNKMLMLYAERYPFGFSNEEIEEGIKRIDEADDDLNPICLQGKHWEVIKLDLLDLLDTTH